MHPRSVRRRFAAVVLIVLGALVAFAAADSRRLGERLTESRVTIGEDSAFAPDPGNDAAFAPFAFGVIGPLRGSDAALERALDVLRDAGGVDFVVLLGDVTATGEESELLRLVANWQDAGVERIAIAGPRDHAQAGEFEAYVSPTRWWFRRNGCLFVGVSGADDDAEFVTKAKTAADEGSLVFGFSAGDLSDLADLSPALAFGSDESAGGDGVVTRRVQVLEGGGHATASWNVARSPTLRSVVRGAELGLLRPLVRGTLGLVAVLLASVICVGLGFRLLRAPRVPPGADVA